MKKIFQKRYLKGAALNLFKSFRSNYRKYFITECRMKETVYINK